MKFLLSSGADVSPAAIMRRRAVAAALSAATLAVASGLAPGLASAQDIEAQVSSVAPDLAPGPAVDPVVARVENVDIHQSDVVIAEQVLGRTLPEPDKQLKRKKVIDYLVDTVVLAKVAEQQNLANDAIVQRRVNFARNQALMERLLQTTAKAAVTDESVRSAYNHAVEEAGTEADFICGPFCSGSRTRRTDTSAGCRGQGQRGLRSSCKWRGLRCCGPGDE